VSADQSNTRVGVQPVSQGVIHEEDGVLVVGRSR
jgi:hypothetical protein